MNTYKWVSVILALSLYFPLGRQILKGTVKQNLTSFILWGTIDAVATASIYVQGGNYSLPLAYVIGCIGTVTCILLSGNKGSWTWFETFITGLVIVAIVAWKLSGPWAATIFSTTGMVLAGLPQVKDAWKTPGEMPALIYFGYVIANMFSIAGGTAWTVEERLFATAAAGLCTAVVLVILVSRNLVGRSRLRPEPSPWTL